MAEKRKLKAERASSPETPFKDLLLADLVDWALIIGFTLLVVQPVLSTWLPPTELRFAFFLAFLLVMTALYDLLFERLWRGQTPGKRIRGLRALRRDGSAPALWAAVLHATLRLVGSIFFSGWVFFGLLSVRRWPLEEPFPSICSLPWRYSPPHFC